ncbi:Hypothetical predicted protein [Prunus dulcis]|uniref:Uncharacterized protein n=1 Tax=Prunus dulcis TaxID=3755 RepID=A0A5E4FTC2_PRUDU|nr:Hypothetical predicted protein [Prunus dulcis]
MSVIQQGKSDGCMWVRSHEYPTWKNINSRTHWAHAALIFIERAVAKAKRNGLKGWEGRFATAAFFICFACGSTWNEGPMWTVMIAVGDVGSHPEAPRTGLDTLFSCVWLASIGWMIDQEVVFWSQIQFSSK